MSERALQRRAAWETLIALACVLAALQVAGDSLLATTTASALVTVGVAVFAHSGAAILKGLRRAAQRRREADQP